MDISTSFLLYFTYFGGTRWAFREDGFDLFKKNLVAVSILKRIKQLVKPALLPSVNALVRVRRRQKLSKDLEHVSRDTLIGDLAALDLPAEAVVLVHSSLKRLGFVEGGPSSVVDALAEVVVRLRGGTLALPTFSIDGTMHGTLSSGRVFDVRSTPSNLGAIPEAFRRRPGVRRSIHPSHSIAALGAKAEWIVRDHHLCGSSFGADSPMVRLMEAGGYLAGLGTGLGTVTFYHCLEDIEPDFPFSVYTPGPGYRVTCLDWDCRPHEIQLRAHDLQKSRTRIDRPENEAIRSFFTERLERYAGLRWFEIGRGRGWIVPMGQMYTECQRLMRAGITIYSTAEEILEFDEAPSGARDDA